MMIRSLGASSTGGFSTMSPIGTTPSASTGPVGAITPYRPTSSWGTSLSATTLPPVLAQTPFMWASSDESPISSSGSRTANGSSPMASRAQPTA